jgi:hypothetical protein
LATGPGDPWPAIHGRGLNCANTAAGESCSSEGGAGFFGGGYDDDNSGSIRYMRIEYSGKEISIDNELNSLTMNAVGRNTSIEFTAFLGELASHGYFIVANGGRRRFDGGSARGFVQFAVVQQYPNRGDKGTEADNSEFNFDAPGRSNPVFSNITYVGTNPPNPGAGSTNVGYQLRRGSAGMLINSVIVGFRGPGFEMTDPQTYANCPGVAPPVLCTPVVSAVETDNTPLNRGIVMVASPNPVRATTNILFGMPADRSHVRARIFNAQGRLVNTLYDGLVARIPHADVGASRNLPGGAYFFRVESEGGRRPTAKCTRPVAAREQRSRNPGEGDGARRASTGDRRASALDSRTRIRRQGAAGRSWHRSPPRGSTVRPRRDHGPGTRSGRPPAAPERPGRRLPPLSNGLGLGHAARIPDRRGRFLPLRRPARHLPGDLLLPVLLGAREGQHRDRAGAVDMTYPDTSPDPDEGVEVKGERRRDRKRRRQQRADS